MANSHHKPTIVLIPGAWHSPSHYHELILRLHKAGYATQCLRLPSVNPDPGTAEQADVANDIAFTREKILLPLVDEAGEDVVVVMHSYGGIPGSGAARGLSKVERRSRGLQGGVVGLVFIAAFPAKEGQSLVSLAAPLDGEQSPATAFEIDTLNHVYKVTNPIPAFYSRSPAPLAALAASKILPQSLISFSSPSPPPAWQETIYNTPLRRAYIRCLQDAALRIAGQDRIMNDSGVEWAVRSLEHADHSPFLSCPDELAAELTALVEGFGERGPHE